MGCQRLDFNLERRMVVTRCPRAISDHEAGGTTLADEEAAGRPRFSSLTQLSILLVAALNSSASEDRDYVGLGGDRGLSRRKTSDSCARPLIYRVASCHVTTPR